eukprot:2112401-Prymnesium_polylepis.1
MRTRPRSSPQHRRMAVARPPPRQNRRCAKGMRDSSAECDDPASVGPRLVIRNAVVPPPPPRVPVAHASPIAAAVREKRSRLALPLLRPPATSKAK